MGVIMADRAFSACPSQEDLVDYFRQRLPAPRMLAIEEHFATCDGCLEDSRTVFETLVDLDSWTPSSVGRALRREVLSTALGQVREDVRAGSEWAERIKRWSQSVARAADGGLELVIEASGARLMARSLRELVAPDAIQFEPALSTRGGAPAGETAPGARPPVTEVLSVASPQVRVAVRLGNIVEVSVQTWPENRRPPGILVIDASGKQRPLGLELERRPTGEYAAQFARGTGAYLILFAPIEKKV